MKKQLIKICVVLSILIQCLSCSKALKTGPFEIAVVETRTGIEKSAFVYYDKDLNVAYTNTIYAADVGSTFFRPGYNDTSAFVSSRGLFGQYRGKKIIGVNLWDGSLTQYFIDRINILQCNANNDYVYALSNLNGNYYVTAYNLHDNSIKELVSKQSLDHVDFYKDYLLCFISNHKQEKQFLEIYDISTFELVKQIDITINGARFNGYDKSTVIDDKLYFAIANIDEEDANLIGVVNLQDYTVSSFEIPAMRPENIIALSDNKLLIVCYYKLEPLEMDTNIVVYDLNTNKADVYDLGVTIFDGEVKDDRLYILSYEAKEDGFKDTYISCYDINNNFKLINKVKHDYVVGGFCSSLIIGK